MSDETKRFLGLILVVVGVLLLAFTGLCTASVAIFFVQSASITPNDIVTIVMFAGPSALLGWGIYAWGRSMRRPRP